MPMSIVIVLDDPNMIVKIFIASGIMLVIALVLTLLIEKIGDIERKIKYKKNNHR